MKRDEFFFPSFGPAYWSASHQALLHHHRQANYQAPAPLWPMPEPDFSHLNNLPMPLFVSGAFCDDWSPPAAAEHKPMTPEERKQAERVVLVAAALSCSVPTLAPVGGLVFFCFLVRAVFRLVCRVVKSGFLQTWSWRFAKFMWAQAVGMVRRPEPHDPFAELRAWSQEMLVAMRQAK